MRRNATLSLCLMVLVLGSSCMQTPQEKLLGRWYNGGLSIRFRKDGSVLMNSTEGQARGRYYYRPTVKNSSYQTTVPNLTLDLIRNQQRLRIECEADLMSRQRMRLTFFSQPQSGQAANALKSAILRRADENAKSPVPTTAQAQLAR